MKAYDTMAQAAAGLMTMTGDPEGPPMRAGAPLADTIAGTFAFAGILAALLHRARTGEGQHVDVSMVDCLLALVLDESPDVWQALGMPVRQANRMPRESAVQRLSRRPTGGSPLAPPATTSGRACSAPSIGPT